MNDAIEQAVAALRAGGVVAYPTEAVFGLGCDPLNRLAVERVFALKRRPAGLGVVLIGGDFSQVERFFGPLAADARARVCATWPGPQTWILPRATEVPSWLCGEHAGVALRITAHPLAARLCRAFGGALVSTSANRHGEPPARSAVEVRAVFGTTIDYVLDGQVGGLERPTPIRDAISGEIVRA